jgi:alpha-L-arabinofuranosidase
MIGRIANVSIGLVFTTLLFAQAPATLKVDLGRAKSPVSPTLYGLMTEEINYSYDGGLYAELVRNRTFRSDWSGILNWFLIEKGTSAAKISVDQKEGPSKAITNSAKLEVTRADANSPAGLLNEGYWGMAVRPNARFTGSFYAKTGSDAGQPLKVALVSDVSGQVLASASVPVAGTAWKEYKFEMQSGNVAVSAENHLEMTVDKPATIWLQMVSLFPPTYKGRQNGNRVDIMEKLAAMHPAFLRFPGGNYLEGGRIDTRFDWKKMIGPIVDRPTHPTTWSYHSSDGMGLLEFLEWCEDLRMEPVLAVYAGYSLGGQVVKPGPDLEPYVQEALEEIEYVTGSADTKWGAVRAQNGHPAPFQLRYVEVGNEDNFDRAKTYDGRYAQFMQAIKAKHPSIQVIATMPVKGPADVVDDHYYSRQQHMFELAKHYDEVDRKGPKIFVGEWATREGTPTPNLGAALGDAAFLTGLERNSDLVVMSAYAPLFVNVGPGGMQWSTDLIGYDALTSYGSPAYYAQVMFASCLGDQTMQSELSGAGEKFFYSVTASKGSKACVKLVNAASTAQPVTITLSGLGAGNHTAQLETMKANTTWATNTITNPNRVVPVRSKLTVKGERLEHVLPPYSIQVVEIDLK